MEIKLHNFEISIQYDEFPESPREWDNLGVIVSASTKYNFGDEFPHELNPKNFSGFKGLNDAIKRHCNNGVILPIFLLDHSGIAISTLPFNDPWDSCQIGYIYCEERIIRKEYDIPKDQEVSEEILENVKKILRNEIKTLNQYLQGEVYCYSVSYNGEVIDSCSSLYSKEYAVQEAKSSVEYASNNELQQQLDLA